MIKDLFKKKTLIIVGVILVILIFLTIRILIIKLNSENRFKYEYEKLNNKVTDVGDKYQKVNISRDNKIKYVTYDEVLDVFNNAGDEVIYIGYPKCLYCRTVAQVLTDTVGDTELDEIYYLDVEKKDDGYGLLLDTLGDVFFVKGLTKDKIYVPSVLFVVDGKIASYNKGTLLSHKDPYDKLEQHQFDEINRIYKNGISDVINSKKNKINN